MNNFERDEDVLAAVVATTRRRGWPCAAACDCPVRIGWSASARRNGGPCLGAGAKPRLGL